MRPLRWKSRYRIGDAEIDRRNRAFVDCINSLIEAAGKREHCREMEDLIDRILAEAEQKLQEGGDQVDLRREFGRRLLTSLPLSAYGSTACRICGLCDLVEDKVAENFEAPVECLFHGRIPQALD